MAGGRVVVRTATERDAAGLAVVYRHAFGPRTPQQVRAAMRDPDVRRDLLVALVDGVVASTVNIQYRRLLVDGVPILTGGIASVATHWDYRGRGLATRLMKEAIRRMRARGVSNTTLFTGHNLPAIRIYRRLGYSETSDWRTFIDVRRPVAWVTKRFDYRSDWLRQTPFGLSVLRTWRKRVHIATRSWSATITVDRGRFHVSPGTRGRGDVVMRGDAQRIFHCFGDRNAFDRNLRAGAIRLAGETDDIATWRRILTLEWSE